MQDAVVDPTPVAEEIVRLKRQGVADLPDVLVFATGQHKPGDRVFTDADLDDMVRNFRALSAGDNPLLNVPVGIGHEHTASPAVGRVTRLWRERDGLHAALSDLPRSFAEALDYEVWRYPSIVVDDQPPHGCPGSGCTLRAVDVVDQPAVKRLLKMPRSTWRRRPFGERMRERTMRTRLVGVRANDRVSTYSEVVMDRAALSEQLKQLGWTDETISALDGLPDEDFAVFVNLLLAQAAGVAQASSASANAAPPSREKMIADLVAAGEEQAALEAMSDADLLGLWMQKVGGGESANAEGNSIPAENTVAASAGPEAVMAQVAEFKKQFAEFKREMTRARIERQREQAAIARRTFAENERAVREVLKAACDRGALTPAQCDPGSTIPNEYHSGIAAAQSTARRKFGEKMLSDFEAWKAKIEALPSDRRRFGEKVAAANGNGSVMSAERRRQLLSTNPIGRAILQREDAARTR